MLQHRDSARDATASKMIAVMISLADHTEGRDQTMYSSYYFEINYSNSKIKMSVSKQLKLMLTGYPDPGMFSVLNKQINKRRNAKLTTEQG